MAGSVPLLTLKTNPSLSITRISRIYARLKIYWTTLSKARFSHSGYNSSVVCQRPISRRYGKSKGPSWWAWTTKWAVSGLSLSKKVCGYERKDEKTVANSKTGFWFSSHETWKVMEMPYYDIDIVRWDFKHKTEIGFHVLTISHLVAYLRTLSESGPATQSPRSCPACSPQLTTSPIPPSAT